MNTSEKIRTIYPLHLAKVYEATRLETEPRERVRKMVGLYEETVRTLALYGLVLSLRDRRRFLNLHPGDQRRRYPRRPRPVRPHSHPPDPGCSPTAHFHHASYIGGLLTHAQLV